MPPQQSIQCRRCRRYEHHVSRNLAVQRAGADNDVDGSNVMRVVLLFLIFGFSVASDHHQNRPSRPKIYVGNVEDYILTSPALDQSCKRSDEISYEGYNGAFEGRVYSVPRRRTPLLDSGQEEMVQLTASRRRTSMWPPWPFSLFTAEKGNEDVEEEYVAQKDPYFSFLFSLTRLSARIGLNKARQVSSQLWFHLPPGAPPFLLLAAIPQKVRVEAMQQLADASSSAAKDITYKRIIPLISSPFARNVALSGFGLAIMSWANHELSHKRNLTPLPLAYRDLNRVILPPFLPVEVTDESFVDDEEEARRMGKGGDDDSRASGNRDDGDDEVEHLLIPPRLQRHWNSIVGKAPRADLKTTVMEWGRIRQHRRRERQNARRLSIYNELLALQALKRKAKSRSGAIGVAHSSKPTQAQPELGYALITGASRGIGRAIAIELARYEIPLILVARDYDRLASLAYDIEACYGVKCCVLQADLSQPNVAEQVFNTTRDAGLTVDLLVNNAGFSMQGLSVDLPLRTLNKMIQLNAVSVSTLTHLFGREMKQRGRGRILMLSSICGAVAGLPSVAVYGATKAFENSLGLALSKEMEPFGVGVTCVMPGAVRDTEFRSRSKTEQALCWRLPFYTKTPAQVAAMAVRATLRGDTESTPGWQNRVFLKVMKPALPQRIHNIIAEMAWNPLKLPSFRRHTYKTNTGQRILDPTTVSTAEQQAPIRPLFQITTPPKVLKLNPLPAAVPGLSTPREPEIAKVRETEATLSTRADVEDVEDDDDEDEDEPRATPSSTPTVSRENEETHAIMPKIRSTAEPTGQETTEDSDKQEGGSTETPSSTEDEEQAKLEGAGG